MNYIRVEMDPTKNLLVRETNYKIFRFYNKLVTDDLEYWKKFLYSIVPTLSLVYDQNHNLRKYFIEEINLIPKTKKVEDIRVLNGFAFDKNLRDLDSLASNLLQEKGATRK